MQKTISLYWGLSLVLLACGGSARVVRLTRTGGTLALEGNEEDARREAHRRAHRHCHGPYEIVLEEEVPVGSGVRSYESTSGSSVELEDQQEDSADLSSERGYRTRRANGDVEEEREYRGTGRRDSHTQRQQVGGSATSRDQQHYSVNELRVTFECS